VSRTDCPGLGGDNELALGLGGGHPNGRLFHDAAGLLGERVVGLLLSGHGQEELAGLAAIRAAGGLAMVQLPESCVDPDRQQRAIEGELADRVVVPSQVCTELAQIRVGAADSGTEINRGEASWPTQSS
jgi:chemotaxis response regulator CheB